METKIPPHAIRISVKDSLYCRLTPRDSNRNAVIRALILLDDGRTVQMIETLVSAGAYNPKVGTYPLCDGWLISASVRCSAAPVPGGSYVTLELRREESASPSPQIVLVQGFISFYRVISWPGVSPNDSLSVGPYADFNANAGPGNGNQLTISLFQNQLLDRWGFYLMLATSGTVATRRMKFRIEAVSGGVVLYRKSVAITQAASLTYRYSFYPGYGPDRLDSTTVSCNIPFITLRPLFQLVTEVANLQVGDGITSIVVKQGRKVVA